MPERLEKLRTTLHELEAELESLDSLDTESRALLEEAAAEIHAALREKDPQQLEPTSLTDRLRTAVQDFEADHPTLAGVVNRIADALGQMGI